MPSSFTTAETRGCKLRQEEKGIDLILGGGQYRVEGGQPGFVLSVLQPARKKPLLIETAFLPHAIALHPEVPTRMALFEKKGPGACIVDLNELKVEQPLVTVPERHFYGHGVYSTDGSLLYCTEAYLEGLKGTIAVRDGKNFQLLGEFPSHGEEPHECQLLGDGKVMAITNGGGRLGGSLPCVTYVEIENQRLLDQWSPTNAYINTGHFAISENGTLVVVSAPRAGLPPSENGGVSIRKPGGELVTMREPGDVVSRMKGEALSVVIHEETGIAVVTHPDGGMVTFWSLDDVSFVNMMELPSPRGVCLDSSGDAYLVSYGRDTSLARVDAQTLELDGSSILQETYLSGSHLMNWKREVEQLGFALAGS